MIKYALNDRNTKKHTYGYKGMNFSANQLSHLLDCSVSTIYNRINKGYAVDAKLRKGKVAKMHKIGKELMTAKDIASRFGLNLGTVYNKIRSSKKVSIAMFVQF